MKRIIALAVMILAITNPLTAARVWKAADPVPNEYIVVLQDQSSRQIDEVVNRLAVAHRGRVLAILRNGVKAFGISMSPASAEALANNPLVNQRGGERTSVLIGRSIH